MQALAEVFEAPEAGGNLVELCLGENRADDTALGALQRLLTLTAREEPAAVPRLKVLVLEKNDETSYLAKHQLRRCEQPRPPAPPPRLL